jgi:hypothetical protein
LVEARSRADYSASDVGIGLGQDLSRSLDNNTDRAQSVEDLTGFSGYSFRLKQHYQIWLGAAFLVSVPVFAEAPLVRYAPVLTLVFTSIWLSLGLALRRRPALAVWGDLLIGFTWTWLCGATFWGWLRWEPLWHIPIEAAALPIALWGLRRGWATIGQAFYLGSLLGTAVTDLYFYAVNLIPAWKRLMAIEMPQLGSSDQSEIIAMVFHQALMQMYQPWGVVAAIGLAGVLTVTGLWAWQRQSNVMMAFSGAVLSTILVDGVFWIAAILV